MALALAGAPPDLADDDLEHASQITRQRLGWEPTHPGLLADLDEGHYFKS